MCCEIDLHGSTTTCSFVSPLSLSAMNLQFLPLANYLLRQYLQDLEEVKAMSVEAPASEDDFQPLCESSRLSIASPRVPLISTKGLTGSPLPPMSPRTPRTPEPTSDSAASPFFLERNIDQVWKHGRNMHILVFLNLLWWENFILLVSHLLARSLSETCQAREPQKPR